ncbi:MAG: HXXEE domain-containing protein [Solibacillus sp.]
MQQLEPHKNVHYFYALLFCLAITLHNLEEALWLPQWSQIGYPFVQPVTAAQFHFAVLVVTALAYVVSFLFCVFPKALSFQSIFIGFLGAMIINAFFPHLLLTIYTGNYAPGLITGLLVIVPINTIVFYKLRPLSFKNICLSTVIVGASLLLLLPVLFQIGRMFS